MHIAPNCPLLRHSQSAAPAGTATTSNGSTTKYPSPAPSGTYQPRWDAWYRWMQTMFATTPFLPQHGNHELCVFAPFYFVKIKNNCRRPYGRRPVSRPYFWYQHTGVGCTSAQVHPTVDWDQGSECNHSPNVIGVMDGFGESACRKILILHDIMELFKLKVHVGRREPQGAPKYASGLAATAQYPNGSQFQSYIHRNPIPFAQVQSAIMLSACCPSCCLSTVSSIEQGSMHEPLAMSFESNVALN